MILIASPVLAQNPPIGIKPVQVRMQLFCAESFEFLMNVLAADFKEYPVMMISQGRTESSAHSDILYKQSKDSINTGRV